MLPPAMAPSRVQRHTPAPQENKPKPAANASKKGAAYVESAGAWRNCLRRKPCPIGGGCALHALRRLTDASRKRALADATHDRPASMLQRHSACLSCAVKAPKMTDAQHDAAEARSAVADLAKFDERFPQ